MRMRFSKVMVVFLAVVVFAGMLPMSAFASLVDYEAHDNYYKVITKDDYELAPGIVESEIVLNNAAGTHRQVAHVVEVDLNNPYTKVIPSYKGMIPTEGNYGVQIMSKQAAYAEENGYGNVVAAMNLSLSWYDSAYYQKNPHLVGEPLGYMILDGVQYTNSQGKTAGAQTCVVINFDEKEGVARPSEMPKVEIRSTSDAITGWEEQVIPANFGFLVKNGVNQYKTDNNASNGASRSFVGVKADGTFVMVMNDGRQAPYSAGFTNFEMAEFMLSLGCVQAVNGDGGGSSAFLSQRPGEELKINCSPSDGAERPTTHGILVISTAPATGEFVRATITSESSYYTPGSTVKFSALGSDLVGTSAEIPSDVIWQLADPSMGTINNGVFVSNGKVGTATAQMIWKGEVVGSASVEIVIPTEFSFSQAVMTVPFDKEVTIGINATVNGGLNPVVIKPEDVTFTTTNSDLGTFDGLKFTSVSEENAPANLTSTLTATLVHDVTLVATASLSLGKGSEVLFDFEDASDVDDWNIADVNGNDKGFYQHLSYATAANGEVHDGVGSMRVEMNPIAGVGISNGGYAQCDLFLDNGIVVKNAKSIGFWAYIPDEYEHCWIRVLYWYDSNNDGKYDKKNTITVINQPEVYNTMDESGWRYFSVDVSAYSEILIPGLDCKEKIAYTTGKTDANNFRFIEFMFPHTNTNDLWKTNGTINGLQTVYVDNITADFSDAVDDREAPIFSKVELAGNDTGIALKKYETVTTASNLLTVTATVAENTAKTNATGLNTASAKAYVDGVEVPVTFSNGRMTISDVAVADGVHRVKFEICDNMGNKSVVIRLIKVASGVDASTVQIVPADSTLDSLYGGSVYWMNMNANKIETIQSVKTVIDLNYGNHFELDNMILADGFTAEYTIDAENNTATIVISRTGKNTQTGAVTLAALPVRVIYYDTDINIEGYTAETYWNTYGFWPYDLKFDIDMGELTYVDGYTSNVLGAFSNEEFSVDTELQTAFSDSAFKAERATAHVHTPVAVDDKEATCEESGYTGRTFCEVCDSVVVWGTVVSATEEHSYEFVDGKLTCVSGGELFNGLYSDGKFYVDGVELSDGWNEDHTSYYKDGTLLTGSHMIDGVMCTFDENGVYLPDFKYEGFYDIDDSVMYFIANEYLTGLQRISGVFYNFDDDGIAYNGEIEIGGMNCLFDKGVSVAEGDVFYAGICGDDAHFILTNDGVMNLVGSGAMIEYATVGVNPWYVYEYRSRIKKVFVSKDITTIGLRAFHNSPNLSEVIFEEGSKLESINKFGLSQCPSLTSIILPEGIETIQNAAFYYSDNLSYVYMPSSLVYIDGYAFGGRTENLTMNVVAGSLAHGCAKYQNINVELRAGVVNSGVCGENLTYEVYSDNRLIISGTGDMSDYTYSKYGSGAAPWADYRDKITKITIGEKVECIGDFAFYGFTSLEKVEFAENGSLKVIGAGAFGYSGLTSVVIPATVEVVESYAFYFSDNLETVAVEDGSILSTIGDYVWRNSPAIKSVYIPETVTHIGASVLYGCGAQATMQVAEGRYAHNYALSKGYKVDLREGMPVVIYRGSCGDNVTWELYDNGVFEIKGFGDMSDYTYSKYGAGASPWALYRENIKKIVIGEGVESIGEFAFYGCNNLEEVEFAENGSLKVIGAGAFGYSGLTSVVIPATVEVVESYAFYFCEKLETFDVEESSQLTVVGDYVFRNSPSLKKVTIPAIARIGASIVYACGDQVVIDRI